MENYLPVFVPVYGAVALAACCFGCFYSRILNRVSILENRYRILEEENYRRNQSQIVVHPTVPHPAVPQPPASTVVAIPQTRQPAPVYYYPTPGIYPTRGAYQPPLPSAPQDPVSYQGAGAKSI